MLLMQYVKLQFLLVPKIRPRLYPPSASKNVVPLWDGACQLQEVLMRTYYTIIDKTLCNNNDTFDQCLMTCLWLLKYRRRSVIFLEKKSFLGCFWLFKLPKLPKLVFHLFGLIELFQIDHEDDFLSDKYFVFRVKMYQILQI